MVFELYNAPSLLYGVDMLFSLNNNLNLSEKSFDESTNCLIISSSYQTTHIVPILKGRINIDKTRRIGIGGFHNSELLAKSLHLKFPEIRNKFTTEVVQEIHENYTMCAKNYPKQIDLIGKIFESDQQKLKDDERRKLFGSMEMYEKAYEPELRKLRGENKYNHLKAYRNSVDYNNSLILQEEDDDLIKDLICFEWPKIGNEVVQTDEELRRKQDMRKEQSKRLREVMQKKREENQKVLESELEELEKIQMLKDTDKYHFEEAILSRGFNTYDEFSKRISKLFLKINYNKEDVEEEKVDIEKKWPFLNIPDEDLTEEQQKSKRIQKMQRNAYLTRLEKSEILRKEKERVEELKMKDPEKYLISLYKRKKDILDRLESYKQMRKDLTNRHSKFNIKRMMMLAELGKEQDTKKESKKKENPGDDFGMNDEDWEVYRGISRHNLSEEEEEDNQQLNEIEGQIIEMDPNYFKYADVITQGMLYGPNYFSLAVDQFRGSELLFKPYIIGVDQAGIIETILSIFKTLTFEEQKVLAENIFLTVS